MVGKKTHLSLLPAKKGSFVFCTGQTLNRERENKGRNLPFLSQPPHPLSLSIWPPLLLHYLLPSLFPSISLSHPCKAVRILFGAFLLFSSSFFPFSAVFFLLLFFGFGNMMKKKMRLSMDPAPSSSFLAGDEAMARFKHQYLLQDYQELLKEAKEKKERLQMAIQTKLKLLTEVKFLRKKYQSFTKTKHQSSKQATQTPYPVHKAELPIRERNCKSKEALVQTVRKLIDLNQVSLPNDEEIDTFDVEWEQLKMDKLRRFENGMADDLKLSVCRDIGSGSNRSVKRKITWQDQLALRV